MAQESVAGPITGPLERRKHQQHRRRIWRWVTISLLSAVIVLIIVAVIVIQHATPLLKGRIIETLSTRFDSRVELGNFNVSLLNGLEASGDRLSIYPTDSLVAAGVSQPLIAVDHFTFHSGLIGLFFKPMRVRAVHLTGLHINVPPRNLRERVPQTPKRHRGKIKIFVSDLICDTSRLIIGNSNPAKDPKEFDLRHIELHDIGRNAPWKYEATLTNAVPRGEIHSTGTFGPWQTDNPGDSTVTGHYTFEHADLNTIKGLGGMLSSIGDFKGQLNRIEVDGTTETPNFSLDTANHPVPLQTQFHAIVDGINGDTYLQPVRAKLRHSSVTTRGAVINIKGRGHRIELDADTDNAQVQDFLELAAGTEPAVMTGIVSTKARLHIRPGKESITRRLTLQGKFALHNIHFTNPKVQDKVDMLSLRARGEPKKAKPGAEDVNSQMNGTIRLNGGVLQFSELTYVLPGAQVDLEGAYSLDGHRFDFHGHVLTKASLSHMVASPWTSLLLKPISPFFRGKNGGADIPVRINGTKSEPKFGLDLFRRHQK